jgi:hypothetical protein
MGKIKWRCGKKKTWKSERVVAGRPVCWPAGRPTCPNHFQLLSPTHTCPLDAYPTGQKQKSEKQLSFFFFYKVLFNSFWIFGFFLKMQKIKNQICCGKGEK